MSLLEEVLISAVFWAAWLTVITFIVQDIRKGKR